MEPKSQVSEGRWVVLAKTAWIVMLIHVAAVIALILVAAGHGGWILDSDAAYSRCTSAAQERPSFDGDVGTRHRFADWPVTLECSYQTAGPTPQSEEFLIEASILQGIGFTGLKLAVVAVPLSWLILILVSFGSVGHAAVDLIRHRTR